MRKYSEPLEEHGNMLISVPGGNDGPSGVLVCSENYITYKNFGDQPDIRIPIPRRKVRVMWLLSLSGIYRPNCGTFRAGDKVVGIVGKLSSVQIGFF